VGPDPAPARAPAPAAERAPARASAPAAAPAARERAARAQEGELVLIGMPDADAGKDLAEALHGWGLRATVVSDGVEAILEIQRTLPRVAVLSAALPRMYGFQICELVKRNESLRGIGVVLVGSIHHPDRYRRPPEELYGADAYVEEPDLPDGLLPALQRLGLEVRAPRAPARREPAAAPPPAPAPASRAEARPAARPAPVDDGLGEQRDKAERLARIIVSDIVLYNEEKFAAALRAGNVLEALTPDLAEGRALFRDRIDERVRAEKDHLAEELLRVARSRS
jgi:CheY-like chemotaxis protein